MEYLTLFLQSLYSLSLEMSVYILFGLLFAGILNEIVPKDIVSKHLGDSNIFSVIKATLFGIPLPVCSCGVIPIAAGIKKNGASKGTTLSFLISTPITGVDSILATFGMFGWIFTIYRTISSMIIAITAGVLINLLETVNKDKNEITKPSFNLDLTSSKKSQKSCCSPKRDKNIYNSFKNIIHYGFVVLFKDISKPLFYGLILGALITTVIPENLNHLLSKYSWLSYILAIVIAVPMYVCATASLPIAAALVISGVNIGAAFVFLTAGPATNTVTLGVVKNMLGIRAFYVYLGSIMFGSLAFGFCLDYIFNISNINPCSTIHIGSNETILSIVSAIILWCLILYFLTSNLIKSRKQ